MLVVARVIACVSIIVVERVVVVSSVAASSCVASTRSGGITSSCLSKQCGGLFLRNLSPPPGRGVSGGRAAHDDADARGRDANRCARW